MKTDILISGFGGQGLMSLGKILAKAAVACGKHTVWIPSYGAEQRGGTAYCTVKISDAPIHSPLIGSPDVAIIFNQPSLEKFKVKFGPTTLVIVNTDLVVPPSGTAVRYAGIACNRLAYSCGSIQAANIVALGFLIGFVPQLLEEARVLRVVRATFTKQETRAINLSGFRRGKTMAQGI